MKENRNATANVVNYSLKKALKNCAMLVQPQRLVQIQMVQQRKKHFGLQDQMLVAIQSLNFPQKKRFGEE